MRPLGPTECISPAFARTKDLLTRPFRLSTYLKLAMLACFAEVGSGSCNFGSPGHNGGTHSLSPAVLAFFVAFAVLIGLAALVIALVMLYLGSRLQLVLVDLIATRQQYVSPFWRKQGPATWRWIGLKLLFFLVTVAVILIIALPLIFYFLHHPFQGLYSASRIVPILVLMLVALIAILLIAAVYLLLRDFALPPMALENVTIGEAFRRACGIFEAEPGTVTGFLLLQMLLVFAFAIAAEILIAIVLLLSLIPFALVGGGAWFLLHHAGTAGTAILIGLAIVGGMIFLAWMFCVGSAILGPVYIFSQAYALYFLGGRYPLLGSLLEESEPVPGFAVPATILPPAPPLAPPNPA